MKKLLFILLIFSFISINFYSTSYASTDEDSLIFKESIMLESISCTDFTINFSRYQKKYDVEVLNSVKALNIIAIPYVNTSKVTIDGANNLNIGNNIIYIYVQDLDNNKATYTINVKRLKENETIYNKFKDTTLSSLSITDFNLNFKSNIFEYNLPVKIDTDNIMINAKTNNDNASFVIKYPKKLTNGSKVIITVTSEDKTSKQDYIINIVKPIKKVNYNFILIIISVIILSIILFFLIKKIIKQKSSDKILTLKRNKRVMNYGESLNLDNVSDVDINK